MNIRIDRNLGTVRIDVTTDPDHLAKYRLYVWRKNGPNWDLIPNSVVPEFSHTADPKDHEIAHPPLSLQNCLLQLVAKANALAANPANLDLQIKVYQDPLQPGGTPTKQVASYPADYHQPVTPGTDLQLIVEFPFELV